MVDVRTDRNVQSADVICFFCETRYDSRDSENDTSIPDFTQYRQDYQRSSTAQRWPYIQNPASHLVPVLKSGM